MKTSQNADKAKTYPKLPPLSPDSVDDYLALTPPMVEERMRTPRASRKILIEAEKLNRKGGLAKRNRENSFSEQVEIIHLSPEDQEFLARVLISPPPPTPALERAFALRKKLLRTE